MQEFRFNVGDTVISTGRGRYIPGYILAIKERYMQGRFCYYVDEQGHIHRDKDLEPSELDTVIQSVLENGSKP